jgi:hypothetical protein
MPTITDADLKLILELIQDYEDVLDGEFSQTLEIEYVELRNRLQKN